MQFILAFLINIQLLISVATKLPKISKI